MCSDILIVDDNNFNIFSLKTLIEYELGAPVDFVSDIIII